MDLAGRSAIVTGGAGGLGEATVRHLVDLGAKVAVFDRAADKAAALAADLYRKLSRSRGREIDLAIEAAALVHEAELWTLNRDDVADVPGLNLV